MGPNEAVGFILHHRGLAPNELFGIGIGGWTTLWARENSQRSPVDRSLALVQLHKIHHLWQDLNLKGSFRATLASRDILFGGLVVGADP
jgi:hypothetical protein